MNVIYVSSFGLKYYTMIMVRITKNRVLNEQFWEKASTLNETDYAGQKDAYNAIYWLNNGNIYLILIILYLLFLLINYVFKRSILLGLDGSHQHGRGSVRRRQLVQLHTHMFPHAGQSTTRTYSNLAWKYDFCKHFCVLFHPQQT